MEIAQQVAEIQVHVPGQDSLIRYADQPGIDAVSLWGSAAVLKDLDPDVLEYHAEGRAEEFLEGVDMGDTFVRINCPTLLLQADPSLGGMMTDRSVDFALSKLKKGYHVRMELGHGLGLDRWNIAPLLRPVMTFLDTL
jgi:hypothetical protein